MLQKLLSFYKENKVLLLIMAIGLVIRLSFILFLGQLFWGRENLFNYGDTGKWFQTIDNVVRNGIYTNEPNNEYGYFARIWGYSFFIAPFYLLLGSKMAMLVIAWLQTTMDVMGIFFVYHIAKRLFNHPTGIIAAFLYATYPFIIIWTPVVYSEWMSVIFVLWAVYVFVGKSKYAPFLSGVFISLAVLNRPQTILFIAILFVVLFLLHYKTQGWWKKLAWYSLAVVLVYGPWPIRNYVCYNKIVPTQDVRGFISCGDDWVSFTKYIYGVKAEFNPQFYDILENKHVIFPSSAYISPEDSLLIEKSVFYAQNCSRTFSAWTTFWQGRFAIDTPNCNAEISAMYAKLLANQKQANPLNYYLIVPLKNLKKGLFKSDLKEKSSPIVKAASGALFGYRTFLLLLGFYALLYWIFVYKGEKKTFAYIFLFYFLSFYLLLSFGTSAQLRDIEMRYFIHADILLLIPGAFLLAELGKKMKIPFFRATPQNP